MLKLPSRLRRLDDALAALPVDDPMLLTELDGFLTGLLVCPELVTPDEWLPILWAGDGSGDAPFEDPVDQRWFRDAVLARYNEIARDLGRGKVQPIYEIDDRSGDILWDIWIAGLGDAVALRPESWAALIDGADEQAATAASALSLLIMVARNESTLDSQEINALDERAPDEIAAAVLALHGARLRTSEAPLPSPTVRRPKIGRNDACPCGSGKKFKRCCGSSD